MSVAAIAIGLVAGILLGIVAGYWLPPHGRPVARGATAGKRRILLPFAGEAISRRSFDAAVRLAKAENAIVMPAFLASVPMSLPFDSALPIQCAKGMPLLEAIEQKLSSEGVPVDSRVGRGRTPRDALRRLLEEEHFDRIIVSATEDPRAGLGYDDLRWLLEHAGTEVLILRPAPDDTRSVSARALSGHF
jgi:nucleotide-binding universal stress UspA family protein